MMMMMMNTTSPLYSTIVLLSLLLLVSLAPVSHAAPLEPKASATPLHSLFDQTSREQQQILSDPSLKSRISDLVYGTKCIDPDANLNDLSTAEAVDRVCDSTSPYFSSDFCAAISPAVTMSGRAGASLLVLSAAEPEATIVIGRKVWLRCFAAARRVCPFGTFTSTCIGGATLGDVDFSLMEVGLDSLD